MNGLDLNHLASYSNEEMARFLDASTDPVIKDLCRRVCDPNLGQEVKEAQEEAGRQEKRADEAEGETKAETERADKAEADLLAEQERHGETETERDAAQLRVEQLEKHLMVCGISLPPAEEASKAGGGVEPHERAPHATWAATPGPVLH